MFADTTSPSYSPTCVSGQVPVTSPMAQRRSPARRGSSTGIPRGAANSAAHSAALAPICVGSHAPPRPDAPPPDPRAPPGGDQNAFAAELPPVLELQDAVVALAAGRGGVD